MKFRKRRNQRKKDKRQKIRQKVVPAANDREQWSAHKHSIKRFEFTYTHNKNNRIFAPDLNVFSLFRISEIKLPAFFFFFNRSLFFCYCRTWIPQDSCVYRACWRMFGCMWFDVEAIEVFLCRTNGRTRVWFDSWAQKRPRWGINSRGKSGCSCRLYDLVITITGRILILN